MTRFIMPIVLIVISIALFFVFTNPIYSQISLLQNQIASYDDALNNAKLFKNQRDVLTSKENSITTDNLDKLKKFLPDNVDNVRLILEIQQIASPYGMTLSDIKYNAVSTDTSNTSGTVIQGGGVATASVKDYGIFNLEFSTSGSYDNFINLVRDLENNLRMVDVSSISFSSDSTKNITNSKTVNPEVYKYSFKIKTYWLKN